MQKRIRVIRSAKVIDKAIFGITIQRDIALPRKDIFYTIETSGPHIILKSGAFIQPDEKTVNRYKFEGCRIWTEN